MREESMEWKRGVWGGMKGRMEGRGVLRAARGQRLSEVVRMSEGRKGWGG